jgi:hypothetical protein
VKRFKTLAALALIAALAAGCSGAGGTGSVTPSTSIQPASKAPGYHSSDVIGGVGNFAVGMLNILLTDAPPNIGGLTPTAINLGIDSVQVISNGSPVTIATFSTPYIVNVMANPGTDPSSIGIGQIVNAPYSHLSFTVDVASSNVVANGQTYPIQFVLGAASQSSVGAGSTSFSSGNSTTITMGVKGGYLINGSPAAAVQADFNAMESLTMNSSGQIIARPTLFAVPGGTAGDASGTVVNANGGPVAGATIVAINSTGNVANTTNTDQNGNFTLHTVTAGQYQLEVYNTYTTAVGQTNNASGNDNTSTYIQGPSVTITAGQTASVGNIAD